MGRRRTCRRAGANPTACGTGRPAITLHPIVAHRETKKVKRLAGEPASFISIPKYVCRPDLGALRQPAPRDRFDIVEHARRRSGVVRCAEGELECLFPQCVYCRLVDRRTRIAVDCVERLGIATVQRAVAIDIAEEIEKPGADRTASISSRRACVIAAP